MEKNKKTQTVTLDEIAGILADAMRRLYQVRTPCREK